ncbi:hypothetical protein PG999_001078 [Apiospora kogelbergensis]|uniref:Rrn9 domain-containing protein n=1 Tax=Apiospora kogelbergensis TaxID=1337665 RepID=A0AAW0RDA5_9PEZI
MASASSPLPSDEYEPSSSEEGGDHHRPNRWDGPPSTWLDMTSEEIALSVSLEETRNADLAVHLYNAFALKRQGGAGRAPVPELDINAQTGEAIRADQWKPHSSWSAWPMPAATVPPDQFMKQAENHHGDGFTIRRPVTGVEAAPSFALEEAVSATALRFAKEKFQARPWQDDEDMVGAAPDDTDGHAALDESDSDSVSRSRPGASDGGSSSSVPLGPHYFKPVVSADDALSYDLLRPSARHILTKLDATLMVLHKSRNAAVNYASESESDSTVASDMTTKSSQQGKRARGRPAKAAALAMRLKRAQSKEAADPAASSQTEDPGTTSRGEEDGDEKTSQPNRIKRGRPKKQYPRLEGETDKQYAIRVARLRKEPRPVFSDDSETGIEPQSDASELKPKRRPVARGKASASRDPSSDRSSTGLGRRKMRHGLRDWRDVLGAAAVAGFSQSVLDRAARRCADLFGGQGLELRTMEEDPAVPDRLLQYVPGMELPNTKQLLHQESEDEEETSEDGRLRRARSTSAVSEDSRAPSRNASQNRGRSGSVSSTGAGDQFFCTVEGCPPELERLCAKLQPAATHEGLRTDGKKRPLDVDSEDEMMGAVHVDGFLRPIKARKGWRGEGSRAATASPAKKRRGRPRKRGGPKSSDVARSDDSSLDG